MTTRRWIDWVNIILGVWLIIAPWLLTEAAAGGPAAWSSWNVGIGIIMLAAFSMHRPGARGDAIGILLGMGLVASPWLLGFANASDASTNAVVTGSLVIGYALWALRIDISSRVITGHDSYRARPV